MFQFPEFAPRLAPESLTFSQGGCPIRKSADQLLFAHPRSLSQLITSFFASESQGIPHTPFITSFNEFCIHLHPPLRFASNRGLLGIFLCARFNCSCWSLILSLQHAHYLNRSDRLLPIVWESASLSKLLFTTLSSVCQ